MAALQKKRVTDSEENEEQAGGSEEVNVNEAAAGVLGGAGRSSRRGMKSNDKKIKKVSVERFSFFSSGVLGQIGRD